MEKGILKKIVKCSLVAVGVALYFVGMGVMIDSNSKVDENVENKEELISNYKALQEFRDICIMMLCSRVDIL